MATGSKRYDVFISHASEDKSTVVRDLAEALRSLRFAVWYDEFSLRVGDSLRKSIDEGLAQSRFGLVVLSRAFFAKEWTQWELDGLIQRQMSEQKIILPVWHEVARDEIAAHSPSLANIVAANTSEGLDTVVQKIAAVLRPNKSSLEVAHELLRSYNADPPAISDDWWLGVAEELSYPYLLADPWRLPVPECPSGVLERGWDLAWAAMQREWCEEAVLRRLICIAHPSDVLNFVDEMPGLSVAAHRFPQSVLSHVPQLSVPGVAGRLEIGIQRFYETSVREHAKRRIQNDIGGRGCTHNGLCPLCEDIVALRHPSFGDWQPSFISGVFCNHADCSLFGIAIADVLFWLLSSRSEWMGDTRRWFLLRGISDWGVWVWGEHALGGRHNTEEIAAAPHYGQLAEHLFKLRDRRAATKRLPSAAKYDLFERVTYSARILGFAEGVDEIVQKFLEFEFIAEWLRHNPRRHSRRASRKNAT